MAHFLYITMGEKEETEAAVVFGDGGGEERMTEEEDSNRSGGKVAHSQGMYKCFFYTKGRLSSNGGGSSKHWRISV